MKKTDVLIIGAGTAGLSAAVYVQRAGYHAVIFEKSAPGGQIVSSTKVENYPGFEEISGADFSLQLFNQAMSAGASFESVDIQKIEKKEDGIYVYGSEQVWQGQQLIIATGASHRFIGLENEDQMVSHGLSFCASCDAAFFKDKTVAVYGGGNTALQDALDVSQMAKKVILIYRGTKYRAEKVLQDQVKQVENIEPIFEHTITRLHGKAKLEAITIKANQTDQEKQLKIDGLFLAIGMQPATDIFAGLVDLDEQGYIITDEEMRTSVPGIYAAGDVRVKQIRQLTTAASDGTVAAIHACHSLH